MSRSFGVAVTFSMNRQQLSVVSDVFCPPRNSETYILYNYVVLRIELAMNKIIQSIE